MGGNVTIPLKEEVFDVLDYRTPESVAIGSVNTVWRTSDGKLAGDNTDWLGIYELCKKYLAADGSGHVVIIGAGGTSRAAIYAAKRMGAKKVSVVNRTVERARVLQDDIVNGFASLENVESCDVLISCVPGSVSVDIPERILKHLKCYLDAAYIPRQTCIMKQILDFGGEIRVFEGWEMLLNQAFWGWSLWTGRQVVPKDEMAAAIGKAMDEQIF